VQFAQTGNCKINLHKFINSFVKILSTRRFTLSLL